MVSVSMGTISVWKVAVKQHISVSTFNSNYRLTRRVSLVEQELLILPEHLSSSKVFCGAYVTRSLVLYVCCVDRCLSLCTFFFWPLCCPFFFGILITSLCYLQTLLSNYLESDSLVGAGNSG